MFITVYALVQLLLLTNLSVVVCVPCVNRCVSANGLQLCRIFPALDNVTTCDCKQACLSNIKVTRDNTDVYAWFTNNKPLVISTDSFSSDWRHVTNVTIHNPYSFIFLSTDAFFNLKSLRNLTIDAGNFGICTKGLPGIFNGLETLVGLNFIGVELCFEELILSLCEPGNMEVLRSITLTGSYDTYELILGKNVFECLSQGRNLTSLSISYIDLELDLSKLNLLGSTMVQINIRHSRISTMYLDYSSDHALNSLSFEDTNITNWVFSRDKVLFQHPSFKMLLLIERVGIITCPKFTLYDVKNLQNCHSFKLCVNYHPMNFKMCPLQLKKVEPDQNVVRTVIQWFTRRQQIVDLSSMTISYISRDILPEVSRDLSLHDNNLGSMQNHNINEFRVLFSKMHDLQNLNLNKNQLSDLPFNLFSKNTRLVTLHLSQNRLTTFNLQIKGLTNLKLLDLSDNNIQILDSKTQNLIEQMQFQTNKSFDVDLSGNLYVCSCDQENLKSIKWIKASDVSISDKHRYTCTLDGKVYDIHKSGEFELKRYCAQQDKNKLLLLVLPPVVVFAILSVIAMVLVRRFIQRKKALDAIINKIQNEDNPWRYLVFLSFCSEDEELVMNCIHPQLTTTIADVTKTDFDLVCVGDKHFLPGQPLCGEIIKCIDNSAVVIAIISKDYCQKNWCQTEIMEAYQLRKPIIMLLIDDIDIHLMGDLLEKIFHRYAHASWVPDEDRGHLMPDWPTFGIAILQLASMTWTEYNDVQDREMAF